MTGKLDSWVPHTSTVWLPKQDLSNGSTNGHTDVKGEVLWGPTPRQKTPDIQWLLRENWSPPGMNPLINYLVPSGQLWKHIHTRSTYRTEQVACVCTLVRVWVDVCVTYVCIIKKKRPWICEGVRGIHGKNGQENWEREMLWLYFN